MKNAEAAGVRLPDAGLIHLRGDGVTLAADAFGPEDGPTVLFFHGGGQSRRAWRGPAQRLGEVGYRAFTVDLRGHGDSDWAADGDYLLDAFARDVEALVDGFDRDVALVGASRGGQAALVGGSRKPGRVSLIMLADVGPMLDDAGVEPIRRFFWASLAGFAILDEAADALAHHLGRPRPRNAAGLAGAMRRGDDGRLYWQWDPKTVTPEVLNPPSEGEALRAAAARVTAPIVLVRAEYSEIVSAESVALFRHLTPQLKVIEAKGVGHMFTGDRNDAFADTLLAELAHHAPLSA